MKTWAESNIKQYMHHHICSLVLYGHIPRPLPPLQQGEGLATFANKTVVSCQGKCVVPIRIYCLCVQVCVTKCHIGLVSHDVPWTELDSHKSVMSVARLETSETWGCYSLHVDRSTALLKGCQNSAVWKFLTNISFDSWLPAQLAIGIGSKHSVPTFPAV